MDRFPLIQLNDNKNFALMFACLRLNVLFHANCCYIIFRACSTKFPYFHQISTLFMYKLIQWSVFCFSINKKNEIEIREIRGNNKILLLINWHSELSIWTSVINMFFFRFITYLNNYSSLLCARAQKRWLTNVSNVCT